MCAKPWKMRQVNRQINAPQSSLPPSMVQGCIARVISDVSGNPLYVIYICLIEAISADPASVLLLLITCKIHLKGTHPLTA